MARRTRDEWRELVDRQRESGLSVSEFCRREQDDGEFVLPLAASLDG